MQSAYPEWDYKGSDPVALAATKLYKARKVPCRLSPFVFMTDPDRIPDVVSAAQSLPIGATIIYRHFGSAHKFVDSLELRKVTFARDQQFLIGTDPELAIEVGADGVHFTRDEDLELPLLWRKRCPEWLITMAGLKSGGYKTDLGCLDGLFISSVFESQSPSAGPAIGVAALNAQCRKYSVPIFALGGVNKTTAPNLIGSGAAGLAGISGLL